jgi:hypothetical protein
MVCWETFHIRIFYYQFNRKGGNENGNSTEDESSLACTR